MLAIFDDGANRLAPKVIGLYSGLVAVNLLVWVWAFAAFHKYPLLLATALLAYGFGLRHAVDADHIAAIDNITRKLMQEGKRPITVGLFFSLGHSTVVFAASLIIALTASSLQQRFPGLIEVGGVSAFAARACHRPHGSGTTSFHVRRDKAALFQRVQTPPGDRSSRKQPGQAWR